MARSHRLLNGQSVAGQSSIVHPQRNADETGIFQIRITGGTPDATIRCEGRADENAPWYTIATLNEGDLVGGTAAVAVPLFPQMRANASEVTSGNANAWLVE